MRSDTHLDAQILAAIEMGWIPARRPDHLWGGRASRGHCAACRAPMKAGEIALEIQFVDSGGARTETYDVHIRCYVALEDEWNRREAGLAQQSPRLAASNVQQGGGS